VVQAGGSFTRLPSPSLATVASAIGAETMLVASLGAFSVGAIESSEARVALASPVHAHTTVGAVVGASTL